MKSTFFLVSLAIFLSVSASTSAAEMPCFVHQVPRFVEVGTITVTGFPTGNPGCRQRFDGATGVVRVELEYQLQRRQSEGPKDPSYDTVQWTSADYPLTGGIDRRPMTKFLIEERMEGEYRLIVSSGGQFLEVINFVVGRVGVGADTGVPYIIPSGTHLGGFRFRAHLGGQVASGYLYQDDPVGGMVVWTPAIFTEIAPAGNLMLDLAEIQALDNGVTFDLTRPVSACVVRDGGGAGSCGRVFDPTHPLRIVDVYPAPASH